MSAASIAAERPQISIAKKHYCFSAATRNHTMVGQKYFKGRRNVLFGARIK